VGGKKEEGKGSTADSLPAPLGKRKKTGRCKKSAEGIVRPTRVLDGPRGKKKKKRGGGRAARRFNGEEGKKKKGLRALGRSSGLRVLFLCSSKKGKGREREGHLQSLCPEVKGGSCWLYKLQTWLNIFCAWWGKKRKKKKKTSRTFGCGEERKGKKTVPVRCTARRQIKKKKKEGKKRGMRTPIPLGRGRGS